MDEALARLRQEQKAPRHASCSPPPSSSAASFSAPVAFLHRCVCARDDLWFVERFERQPSGLYRAVGTVRIHEGDDSGSGGSVSRALKVREIEGPYLACPWCGDNRGKRYHCSCGAPVCGGRVKGSLFICGDSCGDQWEMGPPAREIQVTEGQTQRDYKSPPRATTWQAPARTANPARLLLSSGTAAVPARPKRG